MLQVRPMSTFTHSHTLSTDLGYSYFSIESDTLIVDIKFKIALRIFGE